MNRGLLIATTAAVLVQPAAIDARAAAAARRPNVIVFLSDDLGYGELGAQGNKEIPTPHTDSIARDGVRFTAGYVAATYCSPSRAGLMTGRYPTRFGHEFNGNGPGFGLPLGEKTMADRLKALGYATAVVGKWHLGDQAHNRPSHRGFDEFYGTLANTPFFKPRLFVDSRASNDVREVTDPGFYATDAFAERAVDFIERNKGKPFFLYLPFNAQHAPLEAPQKYLDRFAHIADAKRRTFAAMMSAMDDAIGRVLAKVRAIGQEDNTIVWYFSDNGGPTQSTTSKNGPLRGFKMTTLEGGTRVPFMVKWKGKLPAGRTYDKPVIQLDILPTTLAAVGGKVDPAWKVDGVDLIPFMTGKKATRPHDTLYWRFGEQWAIRSGDFKLVVSRLDGPTPRLYDLGKDIGETKDLAEAHPEKVKQLTAAWQAWNAQQMAPLWGGEPRAQGRRRPPAAKP
jgi:arylsulfatase A-like enzyme